MSKGPNHEAEEDLSELGFDLLDYLTRLIAVVSSLESSMGVAGDIMEGLFVRNDPDWAFILKLHGLFEASINEFITVHLGQYEAIDRMSFYNRVSLAQEIDDEVFRKRTVNFLRQLSSLRNRYVHNVRQHSLTLEESFNEHPTALKQFEQVIMPHNPPFLSDLRDRTWLKSLIELARLHVAMKLHENGKEADNVTISSYLRDLPIFAHPDDRAALTMPPKTE